MAIIVAASLLLSGVNVQKNGGLVFNEVVSDSSRGVPDGAVGSPDWIELYNGSGADIDLTGYRITDGVRKQGSALDGVTIPQGGYILVYASKNIQPDNTQAVCARFGISEKGETLYILSPQNTVVCELNIPALTTDVSYARRDDGTYGFCTDTTPGAKNDAAILNEEQLKGVLKAGDVVISEAMPKASEGCAWAELYNKGSADVNLENYFITNDRSEPQKWHLRDRTLKAGEYAAIDFSGLSEGASGLSAPFALGNSDTGVYLYDADKELVSSLEWDNAIQKGISVTGDYTYSVCPSKGEENSRETVSGVEQRAMDANDPVRISEVLPKNEYGIKDSDGQRCEWVEIHNFSDKSVSLKGYYLSDNERDAFKWAFPDIEIGPQEYKIVFLSGKESKDGELHASFRLSEGEGVFLTNVGAMKTDSFLLQQQPGGNISVGKDENGAYVYYTRPTPGSANGEGAKDIASIGGPGMSGVYISEVCAANKAKSTESDWIELCNGSGEAADITGYYLSDDANDLKKWSIPALSIAANGYVVIEASADAVKPETACFGIAPEGETLYLCDKEGNIIDAFDTGALKTGVTSGRIEGGAAVGRVFFDVPTRGAENSGVYYSGYAQNPEFSETGLYHTESFTLSISCATPGAGIYYTTDGSAPTKASSVYSAPITIAGNTPVRAIAYAQSFLPSEITTSTYIFDAPHTVPVFCLTGKSSEINYVFNTDSSSKPEYPVYVEYYEKDGTLGVEFPSGLCPKGKSSLRLPQNSMKLSLRSGYGQKSVTYPFFDNSSVTEYTTLALRSGGQDSVNAKIRDSFFQAVFKGLNADEIYTKPVVVYANGKYCGLYDLNEEQNEDYMKTYYGVESNNIDMIKTKGAVLCGDNKEYKRVCQMAKTWNLADDKVFSEFAKYVDIDACTDYLAAQIYFGNGDVVNQRFWRARDYSVKWRPLLFDLDFCLRFSDADRNAFRKYLTENPVIGGLDLEGNDLTVEMYIFCGLKKNKGWRDKFIERYVELAVTQFSTERILQIYDDMVDAMEPEMEQHIQRWHTPKSMAVWQEQTGKLRTALEKRQGIALEQLQDYFNVPDNTIQQYIEKYSRPNS